MGGGSSRQLNQQQQLAVSNPGAPGQAAGAAPKKRKSWVQRLSFSLTGNRKNDNALAVPSAAGMNNVANPPSGALPPLPQPGAKPAQSNNAAQKQGAADDDKKNNGNDNNNQQQTDAAGEGEKARRGSVDQGQRQAMKISEIPELYEIDWSKQGELGKGHYAVVFRGKNKQTGELVAAKRIDRSLTRSSTLKQEVQVLRKVRGHPSIVTLFDVYYDDTHVVLILEYLAGGELFDRIVRDGAYSEQDASAHVRKIALALKFMHERGVVHRDLKPENLVLVDSTPDSEIKISDFGLSKILKDDEESMATICGTRAYAAPEVGFGSAAGTVSYTNKVDTWSLGVILYVILAAYHPFDPWGDAPDSVIWDRICRGEWDFNDPVWKTISNEAKDLIEHLLSPDAETRYGADEILSHPWITQNATASKAPLQSLTSTRSLKSFMNAQRAPGGGVNGRAGVGIDTINEKKGMHPGDGSSYEEEEKAGDDVKKASESDKKVVDKEMV